MKPTRTTSLPRFKFSVLSALAAVLLFSSSAFAAPREITITAAVSPEFKKNPEWKNEIRDRVLFANRIFEKQLGLHFTVRDYIAWEPQDETRAMSLLLEELAALKAPEPDGIVAGFHRLSRPFGADHMEDIETVGSARFFNGVIVLRDPHAELDSVLRQVILTHELAHLFGAVHIADEKQIMNPSAVLQPEPLLDPDNAEIIRLTQSVNFQTGIASLPDASVDGLIRIYERLIRANPHSDFYHQLGQFYRHRGQPARAVAVWEEAVRQRYDNPLIHYELGLHYFGAARYEAAIRELGSAVAHFMLDSQKKQKAASFNALGAAYHHMGSTEQAIFNWLKGLSVDPDNRELQGNLAAAYLEAGDVDRGLTELEKLAVKYPEDQAVWSNLGVAAMRKKNFTKAVEAFERALRLEISVPAGKGPADPANMITGVPLAEAHMNLGTALHESGRLPEALAAFEKAQSLDPGNVAIQRSSARAYLAAGQLEKALAALESALRIKKDDPYLYAMQAEGYEKQGKTAEAIHAARQALPWADDTLKAMLYRNVGVLLARSGRLPEAQVELKNAVNLNWKDADTHTNLGYVYAQTGKPDEARRSFEAALRIKPDHAPARQGLEQISGKNR